VYALILAYCANPAGSNFREPQAFLMQKRNIVRFNENGEELFGLGVQPVNRHVLAFNAASLVQAPSESCHIALNPDRRHAAEISDHRHRWLLHTRGGSSRIDSTCSL
jgi:hypothetical protein